MPNYYDNLANFDFIQFWQVKHAGSILSVFHSKCACISSTMPGIAITPRCTGTTYLATALSRLLVTTWIKSSLLGTVARATDWWSPPGWRAQLIHRPFTVTPCVMPIASTHVAARWIIWRNTLHSAFVAWIVIITDPAAFCSNSSWTPQT